MAGTFDNRRPVHWCLIGDCADRISGHRNNRDWSTTARFRSNAGDHHNGGLRNVMDTFDQSKYQFGIDVYELRTDVHADYYRRNSLEHLWHAQTAFCHAVTRKHVLAL